MRPRLGPLVTPGTAGPASLQATAAALARASGGRLTRAGSALQDLQHRYGNHYVQRLVGLTGTAAGAVPVSDLPSTPVAGPAGDRLEREADQLARQIAGRQPAPRGPVGPPAATAHPGSTGYAAVAAGVSRAIARDRSGGRGLPAAVRPTMEQAFGVDFRDVRVHTGGRADALSRAVSARAFTAGQDIFFRRGEYDPASAGGRLLLAHELTHVVQQRGAGLPADRISCNLVEMRLDFVRMKRKETHIAKSLLSSLGLLDFEDDAYGHWWTEIGDLTDGAWTPVESYGWWPSQTVSLKETFTGVPGVLNKMNTPGGRGTARRDPHHGEEGPDIESFHPVALVEDTQGYDRTRRDLVAAIRLVATAFHGSWNWRLGWGKNCWTFQQQLKDGVGLHYYKVGTYPWLHRPGGARLFESEAGGIAGHQLTCVPRPAFTHRQFWSDPKPRNLQERLPDARLPQGTAITVTLSPELLDDPKLNENALRAISVGDMFPLPGFLRVFAPGFGVGWTHGSAIQVAAIPQETQDFLANW
jgi:hypothetical protein